MTMPNGIVMPMNNLKITHKYLGIAIYNTASNHDHAKAQVLLLDQINECRTSLMISSVSSLLSLMYYYEQFDHIPSSSY